MCWWQVWALVKKSNNLKLRRQVMSTKYLSFSMKWNRLWDPLAVNTARQLRQWWLQVRSSDSALERESVYFFLVFHTTIRGEQSVEAGRDRRIQVDSDKERRRNSDYFTCRNPTDLQPSLDMGVQRPIKTIIKTKRREKKKTPKVMKKNMTWFGREHCQSGSKHFLKCFKNFNESAVQLKRISNEFWFKWYYSSLIWEFE